MKMTEIREIAQRFAIKPGRLNKLALIHNIQQKEGNFPCFGTAAQGYCDQFACLWRSDCLEEKR